MQAKTPSVTEKPFEKLPDGREVKAYTLVGAGGVEMEVLNYGGTVRKLMMPDAAGKLADVTIGFNSMTDYKTNLYFGALIGRYGNRIANGSIEIDGQRYYLPKNNTPGGKPCSLHGGDVGFDQYIWAVEPLKDGDTVGLKLSMTSPDRDQGYPGTLDVVVHYWLTPENTWRITYQAVTDKPTTVNMTQHLYFNLKGEGQGTILDHELQLFASRFTPVTDGLIPTGELKPVAGTVFDFTQPRVIGKDIDSPDMQIQYGLGYDHNWVLDNQDGSLAKAAVLTEKTSGRKIEVWTTEPGIQFYAGNFMTDGMPGKTVPYLRRGGVALETQHYPDSPNQKTFPSTILRPGETYKTTTEYRFGTVK